MEILKNDFNEFIKKCKIFNSKIIEAKKNKISINENNKNKLNEITELIKNEIKNFYDFQNIIEGKDNKDIIIKNLNDENDKLKEKLSRYPLELSKGEKLISIIFTSSDENMLYSIICKNTEKFNELEKKLYNDYPQYSEHDNSFMINGKIVNKEKSLDKNKIKNNDIIILKQNNI